MHTACLLRWGLLLGILWPLHVQAQTAALKIPVLTAHRYTLANGLQVLLEPDASRSEVAVAVAYGVGTRDEMPGYAELAHLAEHMAYRGSRHLKLGESMTLVQELGGTANALTSPDHTVYYAGAAAAHLPRLLWLESERMAFTLEAMDEQALQTEAKVVRNELRQRSWLDSVAETCTRVMYPEGHPYHHLRDSDSDVEALELDHVRWLWQQYYRPSNATLALTGAFDLEQARDLVERYFGPIGAPSRPLSRPAVPAISFSGSQHMQFEAPLRYGVVSVYWAVPCTSVRCRAELGVLRALLIHNSYGRLRAGLADITLVHDISLDLLEFENHIEVSLDVKVARSEDAPLVIAALDRVLRQLINQPVSPEELRGAQLGFATDFLLEQDWLVMRALALATRPGQDRYDLVKAALAMTFVDVQRAASEYLTLGRRLVAFVEPAKRARNKGELADSTGALRVQQLRPSAAPSVSSEGRQDPPGRQGAVQ